MTGKLAVVFGGSGFVGRNVVRELAQRGWRVRVAVRRPHHAQFLRPMGAVGQIQLVQANLRHRSSVKAALEGADAVVNLVGILSQSGPQRFDSVQGAGAATIADLSAAAGIRDFVQMSAIGADGQSASDYARTKGARRGGRPRRHSRCRHSPAFDNFRAGRSFFQSLRGDGDAIANAAAYRRRRDEVPARLCG